MAQPTESIKAQPPPEVRLEKLLHPDIPPTSSQTQDTVQQEAPQQQHEPTPRNGQLSPSSAAVASTVADSSYNDSTANKNSHNSATTDGTATGGINGTEHKETNQAAACSERSTGEAAPLLAASALAVAAGPPQPAGPVAILCPPQDSTARQHTTRDGQNGQNGTRNSGDAPLSHSLSMNHGQPPPVGPPRQGQIGYSGPSPYQPPHQLPPQAQQQPSPMHAATQYAYQTQTLPHQHHDPYRAPPPALPSMRTFDPPQPQQQPQQHPPQQVAPLHTSYTMGAPMGQPIGAPMAAPMVLGAPPQLGPGPGPGPGPSGMTFYNTTIPASPYGIPIDANGMRYALLPDVDPRIILANRQKKEIKRRTKTGCLTCRKRRIKCDEGHPTCNNCRKSKRDCLGYDPIFKPQPTPQSHPPAPVRIQPAPSSTSNNTALATPGLASPATTTTVAPSSPLPYQAPVVPSSYPQAVEASLPSSVPRSEAGYEYSSTAIDPALRGPDNTPRSFDHSSRTYDNATRQPDSAPRPVEHSPQGLDPRLGTVDSALRTAQPAAHTFPASSYQPTRAEAGQVHPGEQQYPPPQPRAKKMKVDELIALGGPLPPPPASPPSTETVNEVVRLYYEVYVPGLTHFFETRWYDLDGSNQPGGASSLSILQDNPPVMDLFSSFLEAIRGVKTTNPSDLVYSSHLETCLVWALARLPQVSPTTEPVQRHPGEIPVENDAAEARARLRVVETLLNGDTLESNPCTPPPAMSSVAPTQQVRVHELEFWFHLGEYLLDSHSSAAPAHTAAREACLSGMRAVLDGRENRDVLYSIAVLREYTMQFDAALAEQNAPMHLDERDPRSKLAVAARFMQDEAANSGTTNVVRRFADVAYRAFVRPGGNVRRV